MDVRLTAFVRDGRLCRGSELLLKALEATEHTSVEVTDETAPAWLRGTPMLLVDDPDTGVRTALPPRQAFEYLEFDAPAPRAAAIEETTATANAIEAAIERRKKSMPNIPPNEAGRLRG